MAVRVEDVLAVNVVLVGIELLRTAGEVEACSAVLGGELIQDGAFVDVVGQLPAVRGRVLRAPRERVLVEVSERRSRVTKEYPAGMDDVATVARVASRALVDSTIENPMVSAHGFNFSMVYTDESGEEALPYLGRRIFAPPAFAPDDWTSFGGQGKLKFQDGVRQWTITLEPRLQVPNTSKVFLDINVHVPEAGVPQEDEMETQLRALWERAHTLIEAIDANVHD